MMGMHMNQLIEVPVQGGGRLLVEGSATVPSSDLRLASRTPGGGLVVQAKETLEQALDHLQPALKGMLTRLQDLGSDEVTVDFGLSVGAETGLVVARGNGEVHFAVSLLWRRDDGAPSQAEG